MKMYDDGICLFEGNDCYSMYVENLRTYDMGWYFNIMIAEPEGRVVTFREIPDYKCEITCNGKKIIKPASLPSNLMDELHMDCNYEISGILFKKDKTRWKSLHSSPGWKINYIRTQPTSIFSNIRTWLKSKKFTNSKY